MHRKLKKAQHYVFQSYLQAWCDDDIHIWCLRDNSIFRPNTHNVAQQGYFYEIKHWNEDEIKFYKIYISDQPVWYQKLLLEHLRCYQYPFAIEMKVNMLHDIFMALVKNKDSELLAEIENRFADLQKTFDLAKKNMTEEFYSDIEGQAGPWLEKLQKHDILFYKGEDFRDFITFISMQYYRTKKMSDHFLELMQELKNNTRYENYFLKCGIDLQQINPHHLVHMLVWQYQGALADNLIRNKPHMTLLINESHTSFITSDQPVINIKADYKSNQEVKDLVLYFPVSPKVAILINDNNKNDKIVIEEFMVRNYNQMLVEASHEFIFGDTEKSLLPYRSVE